MITTNISRRTINEELFLCDSAKGLMNCKSFYILLEQFCSDIGRISPQHDEFLNLYFNDEGYVDIWRIPHLMLDAFNLNMKTNKIFAREEFRAAFHQFLIELYTFCFSEWQASLNVKPDASSSQNTLHHLRISQQFLSILMATFINVIENIENYDKAEMKR